MSARKKEVASLAEVESKGMTGSLQKGLKLIELLVDSLTPLTLSELAALAEFDVSSTHRLLQALIERGYAVREESSKRYVPGPRALSGLRILHPLNELRRAARPILDSLRDTTGQTTTLVIFVANQRMVVDMARGAHQLVPYYETWVNSPLHASATGKTLMAWVKKKEWTELMGEPPYAKVTEQTVTDEEGLSLALEKVREQGYAVGRDEPYLGITSMAAPVTYGSKVIGCIAITARTDAIPPEREKEFGFALRTSTSLFTHSAHDLRSIFHMFNSMSSMQQAG